MTPDTYELPPRPTPYREKGWTIDEIARDDLFTASQLQAYASQAVEAERERCARICDGEVKRISAEGDPHAAIVAGICAAAIRNPA